MKRLQRAIVLVELAEMLSAAGSWCGETHMQKAVFFLQQLFGVPLGFSFILYKHGPFSFDLRDELTGLRADDVFTLAPRPAPYGPRLLPTQLAVELKSKFNRTRKRYAHQVEFVAHKFGNKRVTELERLGTALFVAAECSQDSSVAHRAEMIVNLKPHISLSSAQQAVGLIDEYSEAAASLARRLAAVSSDAAR